MNGKCTKPVKQNPICERLCLICGKPMKCKTDLCSKCRKRKMKKPVKNYINEKGEYVNIENKTLKEIWLEGYDQGRIDGDRMELLENLRIGDDGK